MIKNVRNRVARDVSNEKKMTFEPDQGSVVGIKTEVTTGPRALRWHMPAVPSEQVGGQRGYGRVGRRAASLDR